MRFVPRDYQAKAIEKIKASFVRGNKSVLAVLPTGAGKTVIAGFLTSAILSKGNSAYFIVHRKELIDQTSKTFAEMEIDHGIVCSGYPKEYHKKIQICSVQTIIRILDKFEAPDLAFFDEAHLSANASTQKIFNYFEKSYKIGLTGSPARLDGKPLDHFNDMILGPTTRELIDSGQLSPYKAYAPSTVDMSDVKILGGDYKKDEAEKTVNKPRITGSAIAEFKKLCPNGQAIVFCITVKHAQDVAAEFNAAGILAEHLSGSSQKEHRRLTVNRFRDGEIKVLTNVQIFVEGFDLPKLDSVIMLRPTASVAMYLQMVGRALRVSENKTHAVILDHVNNITTHGLPCQNREWSLSSSIKANRGKPDTSAAVKTCKKCFGVQPATRLTCEYCGEEFKYDPKKVEVIDGELVEIDQELIKVIEQNKLKRERAMCRTLEDLEELEKLRGYKKGWARFVFNSRRNR